MIIRTERDVLFFAPNRTFTVELITRTLGGIPYAPNRTFTAGRIIRTIGGVPYAPNQTFTAGMIIRTLGGIPFDNDINQNLEI